MIYDWYLIFNKTEFEATGLVSRTYTYELEDLGLSEVLVTKGNYLSIQYEGITLPVNLNSKNPFEFEDHAVYIDDDNNVYLGIASS